MSESTGHKLINCIDPEIGVENHDGYVRVWVGPRKTRRQVMRHRKVWEEEVGEIPEGYEINHLCKNRRCCNVEHLECIHGSEHASKGNRERYASVREQGLRMHNEGLSIGTIARATGRTRSTVYRWIREGTVWD